MGRIRRRPRARDDLVAIWTYVADENEIAATTLLERMKTTLVLLSDRPLLGRERPELAERLRSFPVGNYILFYRPMRGGIDLIRVRSRYLDLAPDDFQT